MGLRRGPRSKRRRELILRLAQNYGWDCRYCGRTLSYDGPRHLLPTLDHIVPLAAGGNSHFSNLVLACFRCNHRKSNVLVPPAFGPLPGTDQ